MSDRRTLTLMINEHVILGDTPVYHVRYPRLPSDHLIVELSLTPMLLRTLTIFVDLWHSQRAADWGFTWSDQAEPESATGYLRGITLTYFPQAMLQLILHTLPVGHSSGPSEVKA